MLFPLSLSLLSRIRTSARPASSDQHWNSKFGGWRRRKRARERGGQLLRGKEGRVSFAFRGHINFGQSRLVRRRTVGMIKICSPLQRPENNCHRRRRGSPVFACKFFSLPPFPRPNITRGGNLNAPHDDCRKRIEVKERRRELPEVLNRQKSRYPVSLKAWFLPGHWHL